MPNPIKSSDIYQDDGAITRAIEQLGRLGKQIEEVEKVAKRYGESLKGANVAQESGKKQITETAKAANQLAKEKEKLTREYREQEAELIKLREERKKATRQTRLEIKAANAAKDSYDGLSAQYSLNKTRLNAMTQAQRDAAEASEGLVTKTKEIYEEMKRLQKETGKTALNVGNYKESMIEAIKETTRFGAAMDLVAKTPLLAVVGALVAAGTALFQAFTKTERGARFMEKATGALNGVMSLLVGFVDKFVDVAVDAFNDPIGAIEDLWKALKENIVNRFEGIIDLFQAAGKGLQALWERDLPGLEQAAKDAGTAIIQMNTGLDKKQQEDFADGVKTLTEELFKQTQGYINLQAAQRAVIRQNRELAQALESVITEEGKLQIIADDTTRSFKEREQAAEAAREANERRAALELQIAQNNLGVIDEEMRLRRAQGMDVEDLLDQRLSAFQALKGAERDYTLTLQDNEKTRRELVQDRLERDLDILIDGFDNQKTINERIIADETISAAKRQQLLQETQRLADESFNKQIETIQHFTGVQIDANDLIGESNAVVLNEKIRQLGVSEIIEGRVLEIVRDRKTAINDLAEAERDLRAEVERSSEAARGQVEAFDLGNVVDEEDLQFDFTEVGGGLLSQLGVGEKEQQALGSGVDFAKQKLDELTQARVQAANAAVQASDREVQSAQRALQAAIEAAEQGQAANIEARQNDLKAAEEQQREALKQREKTQKAQLAIDTVTQASSLITAASKILKDVPFPLNIAAVGTMFGSFALAKIKAFQAAKIFRDGGLEFLDYGGSHESGNDIFIGNDGHGSQMRAERGEALAVINRKATSRYRSVLPSIIESLNNQRFEQQFAYMDRAANDVPMVSNSIQFDTRRMEGHLSAIRQNGSEQYYTDSRGRMVRRKGNKRTTYL
ncbi:MAG: hypothetical protein MJH10_16220 [Epibacterium sp.]|nr:hypothetical protein [Epibacterium sp.]NQX75058.1 hypothetical protein [Epibacterium sp.]